MYMHLKVQAKNIRTVFRILDPNPANYCMKKEIFKKQISFENSTLGHSSLNILF